MMGESIMLQEGPIALVAGASGGIGRAVTRLFANHGHRVVAGDLNFGDSPVEYNDYILSTNLDVTDEDSIRGAFRAAQVRFGGPPNIVVNASGIVGAGAVDDMTLADWNRVINVNLSGSFLLARESIAGFRAAGWGKLTFISSVNAHSGGNLMSGAAYAASKAGIEALVRHLAIHLAPIAQVNAVAPGPVGTSMLDRLSVVDRTKLIQSIPAKRYASADEIAETIGFLCGRSADYVTGVILHQNGGQWVG